MEEPTYLCMCTHQEQFGPEWDYIYADKPGPRRIADQDDWELSEQKIAGNYGPPMNVWGIALVSYSQLHTHSFTHSLTHLLTTNLSLT